MQHPLYLGQMLPHMALPDAPINYYPYMYPPQFALGNPHLLPPKVPTPSNAKTDRGTVDAERNVNRIADSDTRSRYYTVCFTLKAPFTQAIFAAIFLLLMHAIKWIDLRMY